MQFEWRSANSVRGIRAAGSRETDEVKRASREKYDAFRWRWGGESHVLSKSVKNGVVSARCHRATAYVIRPVRHTTEGMFVGGGHSVVRRAR